MGCQTAPSDVMNGVMNARLFALIGGVVAAAALRLIPHAPNFSPIDAMALFSGAHLGRRAIAFAAPLGALLLSDAVIGFYPHMEITYLSIALIVLLGSISLKRVSPLKVGIIAL